MNKKSVFLTGITGFLGSYLAKELLNRGFFVYALARRSNTRLANERVVESLKFAFDEDWRENILKNIKIIEGDITLPKLGMQSLRSMSELISEVETIYHCAALPEMRVPLHLIRKINVGGTKNLFDFAKRIKNKGKLKKINHISTVYIVGKKAIEFSEDMLNLKQEFNNTYEQSKFEAEVLVNTYRNEGMNISIFRPSMIVGDTKKGKIDRFRLFYQTLHYFSKNIFNKFPVDLDSYQNFINVDIAAAIIAILGEDNNNEVYHVVSPNDIKLDLFFKIGASFFSFKMPEFIPLDKFSFTEWTPTQRMLAEPQIPYFNYKAKFLSNKTQSALNEKKFRVTYMDEKNMQQLFQYCIAKGYIQGGN